MPKEAGAVGLEMTVDQPAVSGGSGGRESGEAKLLATAYLGF